jgi:hypothetical protein
LTINLSEATTAAKFGEWPSESGRPRRAAWETYGVKLMRGRGVERVAHIASAYSSLDDLAWLSANGHLSPKDDHSVSLGSIRVGLYEVGALSGLTDPELEARQVLDSEVRQERAKLQEALAKSRPSLLRRLWLTVPK